MKKLLVITCCALFSASAAQAKIWRVNNAVGANADFNNVSTAISTAAAGDTIHVEGSGISYSAFTLNKKLVIRGTGYFLEETPPNPKTQHNKNAAYCSDITLAAGSKGSIVEGLTCNYVYLRDSLITLQRNQINYLYLSDSRDIAGDTVRHNFINNSILLNSGSFKTKGLFVYNNIIKGQINISASLVTNADGYCINNTFQGNSSFISNNFVYQNNIFNSANFTTYRDANTFLNNVSVDANLPSGNGNITGATLTNLYVGGSTGTGYSSDGRYLLKTGSPAIGAGLLNGTPVDCGAFGGPAPYVLSGMPQMPSIYDIAMPTSISSGTSAVTITVSAAAH